MPENCVTPVTPSTAASLPATPDLRQVCKLCIHSKCQWDKVWDYRLVFYLYFNARFAPTFYADMDHKVSLLCWIQQSLSMKCLQLPLWVWWLLNNFILLTVIYSSTHPYYTYSWKPWFTCNRATLVAYHPSLSLDCQTGNWECFCKRNFSHLYLSFLLPFCNCLSPSESFASVKLTWALLQRCQLLGGEDSTALTFFSPF